MACAILLHVALVATNATPYEGYNPDCFGGEMQYLRSCMTIIGVGSLLLGLLLLIAFGVGYDPTGVSSRLGVNIFVLGLFLLGFWALGGGLLYAVYRMRKDDE